MSRRASSAHPDRAITHPRARDAASIGRKLALAGPIGSRRTLLTHSATRSTPADRLDYDLPMSEGDDDKSDQAARANVPAAPPRPKPQVPRVAPRPLTPGRANPPPPPLPTAAAIAKTPPPREVTPSVEPVPGDGVDESWLEPEDAAVASLAPPPEPSPPPPMIAASPPIAPPPIAPPPASNPFLASAPPASNPFVPIASPPAIASPPPVAEVVRTEPTPVAQADSEPATPKRSRAKVLAFVLLPLMILVGGGFAYQAQMNARSKIEHAAPPSSADATGRVEPPPVLTAEPLPPATHTAEAPSASAPKKPVASDAAAPAAAASVDPAKAGILDTTSLPPGRRIVVDGRVLGTSPRRVTVRCGTHRIQIGDLPPETLELPCGGEINFTE